MVRTVHLDKHKRASDTFYGLKQMRQEEKFCDFTIRVGCSGLKAHRLILAVGSPYFRAMLEHDTKESQDGEVEMKEVDFECVESCIDSMYSTSFDIPDGKLVELLHAANLMQLEDTKDAICKILIGELNAENFFETRKIAEMYDLQDVSVNCDIYYRQNLIAISAHSGFVNEEKSKIVQVMNSRNLNLHEEDKLTVSIRWIGKDSEKKDDLIDLVKLIKLNEVSAEYLGDLLENHPFVNKDLELYRLVNAPLVSSARTGNIRSRKGSDNATPKTIVAFDAGSHCMFAVDPVSYEVSKFHSENVPVRVSINSFSAISLDWHIYIICQDKSVYRLDCRSKTSKWERMQDIIANHGKRPPAVTLGHSLVVIAASRNPSKEVDMFSPDENRWLRMKDKPTAVSCPGLVSLNDSVYCVGGFADNVVLRSFCRFAPSTSEWIELEPMRIARFYCAVVAFEQKIIVIGGFKAPQDPINEVEQYGVTTGQWSILAPMPVIGAGYPRAHIINGSIYVVRCHGGGSAPVIKKYDIANNEWNRVALKYSSPLLVFISVAI